ncbi:MAG: hypothetical protein ACJ75J_06395 [Cytophagaceae bacterium]
MKRKISLLYTLLSVLLTVNLLFSGVAANFLHQHDSDHYVVWLNDGVPDLHQTPDDCLICSLDLLHEIYFISADILSFVSEEYSTFSELRTLSPSYYHSFSEGRAPPFE